MKVIGTAGHIDHGKSTLVHRLTGIDPDRLSEEKRRGMTIDLGFAWLTLPSGRDVSIVDVPGHERFVKNMLAGAGGVDVALLVVAADEGVMPQTREHLDILNLLDVEHGVVALTKVDLVEDEWLDLVREEVAELLATTSLRRAPIVPVSVVTNQGLPELLEALDASVAAAPDSPDRGVPYMPIDRVFTISGFGTVATGTLHSGRFQVGQEVEVVPSGKRARIRALQTHRRQVDEAEPGSRVAANLAGVARDELARGDMLVRPGSVRSVTRVDARLRVLPDAPFALRDGLAVAIHLGSAERAATLAIFDGDKIGPGESGWIQIRFAEPVGALRGQYFIVRLPSPLRTVAGGQIADIAPRHRRSDKRALDRLVGLSSNSLSEAVVAALPEHQVRSGAQLAALLGMDRESIMATLGDLAREGQVRKLGTAFISGASWAGLVGRVEQAVQSYHLAHPLHRGMPKEELRSKVSWPRSTWAATVRALVETGVVDEQGALVALPGYAGGTATRRDEADRVLEVLRQNPFSPPSGNELLTAAQTDHTLLSAMVLDGEVVRVGDDIFFDRSAYDSMVSKTMELLRRDGEVSVAALRDACGTSRKYALSFLEHLDGERITKRMGDVRVPGSKAAAWS
jgi:selenocysteine-specific elongation factor